ncbi:MAG TPA: DUF4239 domain-containing protein, partial [Candidatus Baltobacteraceae bacterium]|nr:DUF4239 domain-containing protein [Candidatus Baltobacteraceae bacterium]
TPREAREQHNDLAGFILAVVGVVYAVLLAFVAIGVWERFVQAERETYDEATNLTVVYRDAGSFPHGQALRAELREYVVHVIDDEWPKMRKGERSASARALVEAVDREVRDLPADTPRLQNIQAQMLSSMEQALSDRDYRLDMQATGINGIMWFVLVAGALVTVAFTYLFGFKQTLMQQLMIGSLSLLVGLILFLTVALDFPFRGDLRVGPDAFENALRVFSYIKR